MLVKKPSMEDEEKSFNLICDNITDFVIVEPGVIESFDDDKLGY